MNVRHPSHDQLQAEFATASHNLREPLRMIRCYAGMLAEQPTEAAPCIEQINHGVDRLETLLNGMFECLQLSEYYHPKRTDLNLVFANAVTRLPQAERAGITAEELPVVHGDFEMLTGVFSRLIDNALKFRSEQPPTLGFTASREDGLWRIAAQDNGIGIEPVYWERCFELFKRLHSREVPGEGFGLAYCRRAIELHGGHMSMDSAPGKGTTIIFTLPAAD